MHLETLLLVAAPESSPLQQNHQLNKKLYSLVFLSWPVHKHYCASTLSLWQTLTLSLPTLQTLHNVDLRPHHSCVPCGSCSHPLHPQSWGHQQASSITGNFIQEAPAPHWGSAASAEQPVQEQEARAATAARSTTIHLPARFLWHWCWRGILLTRWPLWCWQQQSNWHPWPQSSKSE